MDLPSVTTQPAPPPPAAPAAGGSGRVVVAPPPGATGRAWTDTRWLRLPLAVAAGLVLYAAFPPVAAWPLAVLGVTLLSLATAGASARIGALVGLLTGLVFFLPLLQWSGLEVGALPWVLLAVSQAVFFAPLGAALAVVARLPLTPLWAAGLWVLQEALRSRLPFGGFPWGRLAFSQPDTPLTATAALGGAPLVTFAVALLGAALAAVLLRRTGTSLGTLGGGLLAVTLLTLVAPVPGGHDGESVRVAVVQGNVPRLGLAFNDQRAAVLNNHVTATHELADDVRAGRVPAPDLVVWPENSSDIDPFVDDAAYAAIDAAVRDVGVPVLVGAVLNGPGDMVSNTGIVWDPETGPGERYVKQHPVPFGEYIPLRPLARAISEKVDLVPRDFVAGDEVGVLDVGPARLGDVICFEVAYDDLVRETVDEGGRLLVVQTNNATFGRSPQTEQQFAMSRLRAVEHGRAVVVAATSGISGVVLPDGEVVHRSEIFTRDVTVETVPLRDEQTPATRFGNWTEAALALLGGAALLVAARRTAG